MDLQARISAEEVMLQNEMIKLSMLDSLAKARESIEQQKIKQMMIESSGELKEIDW